MGKVGPVRGVSHLPRQDPEKFELTVGSTPGFATKRAGCHRNGKMVYGNPFRKDSVQRGSPVGEARRLRDSNVKPGHLESFKSFREPCVAGSREPVGQVGRLQRATREPVVQPERLQEPFGLGRHLDSLEASESHLEEHNCRLPALSESCMLTTHHSTACFGSAVSCCR